MLFKLWLISLKIQPQQYINMVKNKMAEFDYNNDVYFSDNEKYKLYLIDNDNGKIYFGDNFTSDDIMNSIALNMELITFADKTRENKEWIDENIMNLNGHHGKYEKLIIEFYILWT